MRVANPVERCHPSKLSSLTLFPVTSLRQKSTGQISLNRSPLLPQSSPFHRSARWPLIIFQLRFHRLREILLRPIRQVTFQLQGGISRFHGFRGGRDSRKTQFTAASAAVALQPTDAEGGA